MDIRCNSLQSFETAQKLLKAEGYSLDDYDEYTGRETWKKPASVDITLVVDWSVDND